MQNTIPQPPEGKPPAGTDPRMERALTGQQRPRTLHALCQQGARLVNCGECWQRPGRPCTVSGPDGYHLGRFMRAERRGLITRAELARVVSGFVVIGSHVIVLDVAPEPIRLDGCTCQAIRGSHAHGCPWSAQ
jgi:hypothetical protein